MKLRDLEIALSDIAEAQSYVREAYKALAHGGSDATMIAKHQNLAAAQLYLETVLDREIGV